MDNSGDLNAMLASLLNDPSAMQELRSTAEKLGLDKLLGGSEAEKRAAPQPHPSASQPDTGINPELLGMLARLSPLLSGGRDDNASRLLHALRPYLSEQRAGRLDDADRLLSAARMLSILKESKLM